MALCLLCSKPVTSAGQAAAVRHAAIVAPTIEVAYREVADRFEILDQVSRWWPEYVEPEYWRYWTTTGRAQAGDSSYFARYAELRARHFDRAGQQGSGSRRAGSGLFTAASTLTADPVGAAFYQAATLDDAFARLGPILSAQETAFLREFYAHFEPRTAVLTAETRLRIAASREATDRMLHEAPVAAYLGEIARFFAPPAAAAEAHPDAEPFIALYVWWPDSDRITATPRGRTLVLRVRPRADETVNSADVVVHEAVHVMAARLGEDRQRALSGVVLDACTSPESVRRLAVLEEPLATALGNIEFRRRFMPARYSWSRRWYGDPWVDVSARLLHPVLVERLAAGGTLDGAFAGVAGALCASLAGVRAMAG